MTEVPLREYVERRLDEQDRRIDQRFVALERALEKSERALETRLHGMNEFRDALRDQANKMATIIDLDKVDQAVRDLQRAKANLDGRILMLVTAVSAVVSLGLWVLARTVFR